jgi:predicted small lipoprotein YifL
MKVATYFYVGLIIIFLLSACSLPGPQSEPPPQQTAPSDPEPEVKRPTSEEIKGRTINNQFTVPIPITETFTFAIPPSWTGNYIVGEFSSSTKRPPRQQPLEGKLDGQMVMTLDQVKSAFSVQ